MIVRAVEQEETTARGSLLPENRTKEKPPKGKVLDAGDGQATQDDGQRIPRWTSKRAHEVNLQEIRRDEIIDRQRRGT